MSRKKENKPLIRSKWKWWARKRAFYTVSMMVSGLAAYFLIIYPKPDSTEENEVNNISFTVHLAAFFIFLVAINIFFFIGLLIDHVFNKKRTEKFQLFVFYAIMLVSLPIPFLIPIYFPEVMQLIFNVLFSTLIEAV